MAETVNLADCVDRATFQHGMSHLGAAVNIVTTSLAGSPFGFTASAVCSVSDTPATLLVCINRTSSCFPAFEQTRFFCVNTLAPGHQDLSNLFGGKTEMALRFAQGTWHEGRGGVPVLSDALVSFQCRLVEAVDHATHRILFGQVMEIETAETKDALLYVARRYHVVNG